MTDIRVDPIKDDSDQPSRAFQVIRDKSRPWSERRCHCAAKLVHCICPWSQPVLIDRSCHGARKPQTRTTVKVPTNGRVRASIPAGKPQIAERSPSGDPEVRCSLLLPKKMWKGRSGRQGLRQGSTQLSLLKLAGDLEASDEGPRAVGRHSETKRQMLYWPSLASQSTTGSHTGVESAI